MTYHRKRSPSGVVSKRPISLRLMPEELKRVEEAARSHGVTLSAMARDAVIAGLPILLGPDCHSSLTDQI